MKILVITDSIDVNNSSGAKANVALIKNLDKVGFKVKVLHYSFKEINLENIQSELIKEIKWSWRFLLSRFERLFTRFTKINLNPSLENWFGFSFTFLNDVNSINITLQKENPSDYDWVLTLSKAASFRPHAAVLKNPKWHSKWLAYVHDPYPMHAYPRPYDWVEPGHHQKRNFFWQVTEMAKYVIYPSKLLAEWMRGYYYNQTGKEVIIPHQIDTENFEAVVNSIEIDKSKFNIIHAGSLMDARNPEWLVEGFINFLNSNPESKKDARLFLIGPASRFDAFIKEKQKVCPQIIISNGYIPFEEVRQIMQMASVNVILEAIASLSPFLPGKFPHCVQANKPILLLGPYYSESRRLLGENYEFWSEVQDLERIEKLIQTFYCKWRDKKLIQLNRVDLEHYLSVSHLGNKMNSL